MSHLCLRSQKVRLSLKEGLFRGEVYKWIKASSVQIIFSLILLQTMLRDSDGAMLLSWLLELLVLSSFCSAMFETAESSGDDLNTYNMTNSSESSDSPPWLSDTPMSHMARMSHVEPWPPGNMSDMTGDPDSPMFPMTSICDMLWNSPVPPTLDQIPFFCLCSHCKGTGGPKGDRGDRGLPGAPGSPGRRGMMGFPGRPGFTGRRGIKGQKGDLGEKGSLGAVGFTGVKGQRGFKGDKGDQGMEGPPGSEGPQGETGTCPASCESLPGPPGEQGVPGPAGTRGLPGVQGPMAPKGIMGNKGDMGMPGDSGMNGQKGDQGERGLCECTDGADGSDGNQGEQGGKGDKGDTGAQGVQGSVGLKGNEGSMGLMGPPGPCSPAIQSAFSASLNQSFPAANWPVPFQRIHLNMQGHFDTFISIYTAPINGTYVFTFSLAISGKPLKVGLFLNFSPVVKKTEVTIPSTMSHTVVLHLTMGDRVWLQVRDSSTNGMFTDRESTSTFSGYLMYPDSCQMPRGRGFPNTGPTVMPAFKPQGYKWDSPTPTPTTHPPQ
ncbi:inner ear-specific collagen-like [Anarrhichthys ocellatus]|uniref:inner ear-specific collagen-like n=1 Tax=Anarrhichthys ocellatus TaxID=433405 RepID=UPI0012ECBB90|nr:inner ear-specific collagen-like [Anarrhichthys ocellatus]